MSSRRDEQLDLDTGLVTTPDDVRALAELRIQPMSYEQYFAFLARLGPVDTEALERRPFTIGEPFRLEEGD